jgi:hypothetical protein
MTRTASTQTSISTPADDALALLRLGLVIANEAAVECIECEAVRVDLGDGLRWYDIRPMCDPREHCAESIELNNRRLQFAEACGLITRTADRDWLVCINTSAARVADIGI